MPKKKKNKKISILLIILTIVFSCVLVENGSAKLPKELYYGESFTWTIENISTENNLWYNVSDFSFVGNWHANQSDIVGFTALNSVEIESKEYLTGNLDIGNLTIETHDQDIGFNLGLSAYPWYGGLVSLELDWDELTDATPFNGSDAQVTYNVIANVLNKEVEAIRIAYDDGFQITELLYEPKTGILLGANTTTGFFSLSMLLTSSSIPLPTTTNNFPAITIVSGFLVLVVFSIVWRRRKKTSLKH